MSRGAAWMQYPPRGIVATAAVSSAGAERVYEDPPESTHLAATQVPDGSPLGLPAAAAAAPRTMHPIARADSSASVVRPWSRASMESEIGETGQRPGKSDQFAPKTADHSGKGKGLVKSYGAVIDGDLVLALEPSTVASFNRWERERKRASMLGLRAQRGRNAAEGGSNGSDSSSSDSDEDDDGEDRMDPGSDARAAMEAAKHQDGQGQSNFDLMMQLPGETRRMLYQLVVWPWFDRVVLMLVFINCVFLALDRPGVDPESPLGRVLATSDLVFVVIFAVECAIKLVALGIMREPDGYFRSAWNWLDFLIVLEGIISTTTNGDGQLSGLRAFRVLRPLKTVSRLEGLKVLVNALLASLPMLCNTLIVCGFYFVIFGIVGVQIWRGLFVQRCFVTATGLLDEEDERLCGGMHECGAESYCGVWTENPAEGVVSFDNILWACSTIFASITLEGWAQAMYDSQDSGGRWSWLFHVLMIVFGAFILMNLTLAIILTKFRDSVEEQERDKVRSQLVEERKALMRARILRMRREREAAKARQTAGGQMGSHLVATRFAQAALRAKARVTAKSKATPVQKTAGVGAAKEGMISGSGAASIEMVSPAAANLDGDRRFREVDAALKLEDDDNHEEDPNLDFARGKKDVNGRQGALGLGALSEHANLGSASRPTAAAWAKGASYGDEDEELYGSESETDEESGGVVGCMMSCCGTSWGMAVVATESVDGAIWAPIREQIGPVVQHSWFDSAILACIVLNTAVLAIDHHDMDEDLERGLALANVVFTFIFVGEMILKWLGLGLAGYFSEASNVFDFVIVVLSLVEIGLGGSSSFAAFRTVRLFRVARVAQYLQSMKMIIDVVGRSLESFGYIALLLLLFCFIYSVLGMQLFGGAFDEQVALGEELPRNNFDTLLWSFVTVFQILAGEAWNEVMYSVVGATNPVYILYFISWVVIGQFILLNLFLAVLLDNFSQQEEEDEEELEREALQKVQGQGTVGETQSLGSDGAAISGAATDGSIRVTALADATGIQTATAATQEARVQQQETRSDYSSRPVRSWGDCLSEVAYCPMRTLCAACGNSGALDDAHAKMVSAASERLRRQKKSRKVRQALEQAARSREASVANRVETARLSLGSLGFMRPKCEVALMAMVRPLAPGALQEYAMQQAVASGLAHEHGTEGVGTVHAAAPTAGGAQPAPLPAEGPSISRSSPGKAGILRTDSRETSDSGDDEGVSLPEATVRLSEVMLRELVYLQAERRARTLRERKQRAVEAKAGVLPVDSAKGGGAPAAGSRPMSRASSAPAMQRKATGLSPLERVLLEVDDALPPTERVAAIQAESRRREMQGRPRPVLKPRLPITLAYELGSSQQWARQLQPDRPMLLDVPQNEHDRRLVVCMNVVRKWRDFMGARKPAPANEEALERLARGEAQRRIRAQSAASSLVPSPERMLPSSDRGPSSSPLADGDSSAPAEFAKIPSASPPGVRESPSQAAVIVDASNLDAALELGSIGMAGEAGKGDSSCTPPPTSSRVDALTCQDTWEHLLARSLGLLVERRIHPADADLADEREIEEGMLLPRDAPAVEAPGDSSAAAAVDEDEMDPDSPEALAALLQDEDTAERKVFLKYKGNHVCCVPRHGAVAKFMRWLVESPFTVCTWRGKPWNVTFDGLVLLLILVSSILLASESPPRDRVTEPNQDTSGDEANGLDPTDPLTALEIVFTVLFTLEIIIKILAYGFLFAPGAYLLSAYNVIDFLVVVASVLNLALTRYNFGFLRTLRLLRTLRPLRVISRNEGMRVVVSALISSIGGIVNVAVVVLLVWLMFAILGVQLFAGRMGDCNDPDFPPGAPREGILLQPGNASAGFATEPCGPGFFFTSPDEDDPIEREWVTPEQNFDNVFNAILLLFVTSSGEGWPDVMFRTADVTGVERQRERDASAVAVVYFIAFIVVGSFFFLNLFVGVVFDNFMRLKKEYDSAGFLTDGQRDWVGLQRRLARASPEAMTRMPADTRANAWRRQVFLLVNGSTFRGIVLGCISLNIVALGINYAQESDGYALGLEIVNYVFSLVFFVEAGLKIYGLGLEQYFASPWNQFDFVVVLGSIADVVCASIDFPLGVLLARIFRIMRVLRVVRLGKEISSLRRLILTLWAAIPSLINVGSLLLLLFFIYAIMGVQSFGHVALGESIDAHANFFNFANALLTLFRISTGEGWEGIMYDCMVPEHGGTAIAPVYFVSFVTIASFVMLNLFITIIVDEFEEQEQESDGMTEGHLRAFNMVWKFFDPAGTGRIPVAYLEPFLRHLPQPMGIRPATNDAQTQELQQKASVRANPKSLHALEMQRDRASFQAFLARLKELDLTSYERHVHYSELLLAVHRTSFGSDIPQEVMASLGLDQARIRAKIERKALREAARRRLVRQYAQAAGASEQEAAAMVRAAESQRRADAGLPPLPAHRRQGAGGKAAALKRRSKSKASLVHKVMADVAVFAAGSDVQQLEDMASVRTQKHSVAELLASVAIVNAFRAWRKRIRRQAKRRQHHERAVSRVMASLTQGSASVGSPARWGGRSVGAELGKIRDGDSPLAGGATARAGPMQGQGAAWARRAVRARNGSGSPEPSANVEAGQVARKGVETKESRPPAAAAAAAKLVASSTGSASPQPEGCTSVGVSREREEHGKGELSATGQTEVAGKSAGSMRGGEAETESPGESIASRGRVQRADGARVGQPLGSSGPREVAAPAPSAVALPQPPLDHSPDGAQVQTSAVSKRPSSAGKQARKGRARSPRTKQPRPAGAASGGTARASPRAKLTPEELLARTERALQVVARMRRGKKGVQEESKTAHGGRGADQQST